MGLIVVVGGGPVGSAVALKLSRGGRKVLLLDAGGSRDKVCGEGLLPAAWRVLTDLDVTPFLTQRAAIEGIRYGMPVPGDGVRTVSAALSLPAYGVQRPRLVDGLGKALEDSQVEVWAGARLRDFSVCQQGVELKVTAPGDTKETLKCDTLIGADGLHSLVRRKAGLQSEKSRTYARWGARCYFRSSQERHQVEVTLGNGLESYLTPLGGGLYGLAFLWSPERLGRPLPGEGRVWERLLELMGPEMRHSLPTMVGDFEGDDKAIGPLQQPVSSPLHPSGRVALVGDAAGYLDALTGEGLCLGLRQAESLADCILTGRISDYPKEHRAIKFRHNLTVSGLLWLVHQPKLRERVFSALIAAPGQFSALLRFAVEEASWASLVCPDSAKFVWKLLTRLSGAWLEPLLSRERASSARPALPRERGGRG